MASGKNQVLLLLSITALIFSSQAGRIPLMRHSAVKSNLTTGSSTKMNTIDMVSLYDDPYLMYVQLGNSSYSEQYNYMALSLFTNTTFFSESCSGFSSVQCTAEYGCFYSTSSKSHNQTVSYPYFNVSGYTVQIPYSLYYGEDDWATKNGNALWTQSCSGDYGYEVAGSIGFGASELTAQMFLQNNYEFSVYLNPDGDGGELVFGEDTSYIVADDEETLLYANANWTVTVDEIMVSSDYIEGDDYSLIFDLSLDKIAVPSTLFNDIVSYLDDYDLYCYQDGASGYCNYDGSDYTELPNIVLYTSGGDSISLPPSVYLECPDCGGDITFNIVATLVDGTYEYQSVTQAYSNYIILGTPFFSYYYAIFNFEGSYDNYIYLYGVENYPACFNCGGNSGNSNGEAIAIVMGVIVFFVMIVLCICCCAAQNKSRNAAFKKTSPTNANNVISSATTNAYLPPDQTQQYYNQQNYNQYQQYPQNDAMMQQAGNYGQYGNQGYGNQGYGNQGYGYQDVNYQQQQQQGGYQQQQPNYYQQQQQQAFYYQQQQPGYAGYYQHQPAAYQEQPKPEVNNNDSNVNSSAQETPGGVN